jgi:hypothetical protein
MVSLPVAQHLCVVLLLCCAVLCCAVLCCAVPNAAIGRLQDESQLVVKAALQLMCKMLHQGIFPPPLSAQVGIGDEAEPCPECVLG